MRLAKTVLFSVLSLSLLALAGCGSKYQDKVVGTWDTDMPGHPRFKIEKDGTGSMSVQDGGQAATKSFKWRIGRGDNLIFTIDGKDLGGVIKSCDGDTMTVFDPQYNQTITFKRVQ